MEGQWGAGGRDKGAEWGVELELDLRLPFFPRPCLIYRVLVCLARSRALACDWRDERRYVVRAAKGREMDKNGNAAGHDGNEHEH